MKSSLLALLVTCCAGFTPVAKKTSPTVLAAIYADEVGVTEPLGFYDPLGLLTDATPERYDRLRAVELKHGRISMLAVVGYLTTAAGIRFPGAQDIPDGLQSFPALHRSGEGYSVLMQMVAFFAVAEMVNRDAFGLGEFVGDFRNGVLDFGWDKLDQETKLQKRNIEINQGRAAMMGITALIAHEVIGVSILPNGYLPGH